MEKIEVEVIPSLVDGLWDIDIIKNTDTQRIVKTIWTGMHTKASAIGYGIRWLEAERCSSIDDQFNPLFKFNDYLDAQYVLEQMECEISKQTND